LTSSNAQVKKQSIKIIAVDVQKNYCGIFLYVVVECNLSNTTLIVETTDLGTSPCADFSFFDSARAETTLPKI